MFLCVCSVYLTQGLFDSRVENTNDVPASFSRLAEVVHTHYPDVVVPHFVYGYGRALWDPAVRTYGRHTLQVRTDCIPPCMLISLPPIRLRIHDLT